MQLKLSCVKCGHVWEADKEPIRCANNECRSRGWQGASSVQQVASSSVQRPPVSVQASTPVDSAKAGPWKGKATSEYRQCRQCGKEFHSNKDLTAMQQHVDHLQAQHLETGWGEAYARIQATKHKTQHVRP